MNKVRSRFEFQVGHSKEITAMTMDQKGILSLFFISSQNYQQIKILGTLYKSYIAIKNDKNISCDSMY